MFPHHAHACARLSLMPSTPESQAGVTFAPGDLDSNRRGTLSAAQVRLLREQRLAWAAGAAAFGLLSAALPIALVVKLRDPSFADRGLFFLGLALGVFWLWVLREAWPQWRRVTRDLRERGVALVDGPIYYDLQTGPGLVPILKYKIRIGDQRFSVSQAIFFQFENGRRYRIYYSACARLFLSAVPLDARADVHPDTPAPLEPAHPPAIPAPGSQVAEPLTRREMEILALIAAGHSNREIADRLFLSVNTVKMYTTQLYHKLGVGRRTEAVARARELGLL
jgi:DNA-binding CsgD family transcriptional regulator